MAKAIENAQRDLNIAFVNEIALLCHKLGIKTKDVLTAAGTKWNFLKFTPGLVGGHCIGVDPYYLVEIAKQHGMTTQVIASGRALNDGMSKHVADVIAAELKPAKGKRVLVLGLTFKENIPDTRNSKSEDVVRHLEKQGCVVEVHDPNVAPEEIKRHGHTIGSLEEESYDAVVLLVPHREYLALGTEGLLARVKPGGLLYDLKSVLDEQVVIHGKRTYLAL
jgi:UDP-N-acetyl-D-galactosamine dehydrogenase